MALGIAFDIGAYSCKAALLRGENLEAESLLGGEPLFSVAYVEDDGSITVNGASDKADRRPERGIWNVKHDIILGEESLPGHPGISPIDVYVEMIKEVLRRTNAQLLKNGDKTVERIVLTVPAILEEHPEIIGKMKRAAESIKLANGKNLQVELLVEPAGAGVFNMESIYRNKKGRESAKKGHTIILFDLGHSTLDVALVTLRLDDDVKYDLHYFKSDAEIYCEYFDKRICEEIRNDFANRGIDVSSFSARSNHHIRQEAKNIKHALSNERTCTVDIEIGDDYLDFTMTRDRFNELAAAKMEEAANYVTDAISVAEENGLEVESIVMAGGGSFMPIVEEYLKRVAGEIPVKRSLRPIDAVSFGAARHCLMHDMVQRTQYSYGLQIPAAERSFERNIHFVVPADSKLPFESKPLRHNGFRCDEKGVYRTVLYYSDTAKSEDSVVSAEKCSQIRYMTFELPANKTFDFVLRVDENHCVKVICKTSDGENFVMTSHDAADARSRKE